MTGAPQGVFAGPLHGAVSGAVFALLLGTVCVSDLRTRRIPNRLVLAIACLGFANALLAAGTSAGQGVARAAAGMGVGFVLWLPFYLLRMMGAGDVKFFAAACAWLGPAIAVRATLLSAVFGGVLALLWVAGGMVRQQRAVRAAAAVAAATAATAANGVGLGLPASADARFRKLPYGVAMAAGLAVAAWMSAIPS